MWLIFVLAALLAAVTGTALELSSHTNTVVETSQAARTAGNVHVMAVRLDRYVQAHPDFQGVVSTAALTLPNWYQPYPGMKAYAAKGRAYLYQANDPVAWLRDVSGPGVKAGIKQGSSVEDMTGRKVATLEGTASSAIPARSAVLVVRGVGASTPPPSAPSYKNPPMPAPLAAGTPLPPPEPFDPLAPVKGGDPVAWVPRVPAPPLAPPAPPTTPPCDTVVTDGNVTTVCGIIELSGIPGWISAHGDAQPGEAKLTFTNSGKWQSSDSPTAAGAWLKAPSGADIKMPGEQFEMQVTSHTSWTTLVRSLDGPGGGGPGMSIRIDSDSDDVTGWMDLGKGVEITLRSATCSSTSESATFMPSDASVTIKVRSKHDHSKTWTKAVIFQSCGGCFAADTEVLLGDGSWGRIGDLRKGDSVMSFILPGLDLAEVDLNKVALNDIDELVLQEGMITNASPFSRRGGVAINGIKSTDAHVYFVHDDSTYHFAPANALSLTTHLVGRDKADLTISSATRFSDLTRFMAVSVDTGTFIVRANPDSPAVLVHNRSGGVRLDPEPNPFAVKHVI